MRIIFSQNLTIEPNTSWIAWPIAEGLYRPNWPTVVNLVEDADDELLRHVLYNVLHPLYPDRNEHGYELRRRRHERILTTNDDKRNFVYRQLHKYSY